MSLVSQEVKAAAALFVIGALLLWLVLSMAGCTYNYARFEPGSISPEFTLEPSAGNEEGGATGGEAMSQGKLSPSGSVNLDGFAQFSIVVQQAGETPTTTTPTASANVYSPDADASVNPTPEPPPVE